MGSALEISIALIAVAFVVLVIYLIGVLRSASQTLSQVNQLLRDNQSKISDLSLESVKLLQGVNQLTEDVQVKMEDLDPLFHTVRKLGDKALYKVGGKEFRPERENLNGEQHSTNYMLGDIADFIALGLNLWMKWKK